MTDMTILPEVSAAKASDRAERSMPLAEASSVRELNTTV